MIICSSQDSGPNLRLVRRWPLYRRAHIRVDEARNRQEGEHQGAKVGTKFQVSFLPSQRLLLPPNKG